MLWYLLLMIILYILCSVYIVILMGILFINFNYFILMLFEIYTIVFLYLVMNEGSSYERGNANIYLIIFGYVIGMFVVISNNLSVISLILLLLGISNLPIYSLHIWLPNVHVEASIIGSMILASSVLKLSILYYWNFGTLILVGLLVVMSLVNIGSVIDSKSFAAYSSVLHITLCVLVGLVVILLIGYMHIVLSPLIFISVYICYVMSSNRYYVNNSVLIIVLWIVNFGLPLLGSFFSEVYIILNNSIMLVVLLIIYLITGYIIINSINDVSSGLFYIPFIVLYLLVV